MRYASHIFKNENLSDLARLPFRTLRQLAAIEDMRPEWGLLTISEANRRMMDKASAKEVSSKGMIIAYKKGVCEHGINECNQYARSGITIVNEDSVSDAITCAIGGSENKFYRRNCILLVPSDSSIAKCGGVWKELKVSVYKDWDEQKKELIKMYTKESFPKSLWIVVPTTLVRDALDQLKAFCERSSKNQSVTFYVSVDVFPLAYSNVKNELIREQQEYLTAWRLQNTCVNIVVVSSISALLWGVLPFTSIFLVARRETKELVEQAVRNIVDGCPFPMDAAIPKPSTVTKRVPPSTWDNPSSPFHKRRF